MQDLANYSGYVIAGVAMLLLGAAVLMRGRIGSDETGAPDAPSDGPSAERNPPAHGALSRAVVPESDANAIEPPEPVACAVGPPSSGAQAMPPVASVVLGVQPPVRHTPAARAAAPGLTLAEPEALMICGGLAVVAVSLAASLWDAPDALGLFWLLVVVGAAFAVVARIGLSWRPATWPAALGVREPVLDLERAGAALPVTPDADGSFSGQVGPTSARTTRGLTLNRGLLVAAVLAEAACLTFFAIGRLRSAAWLLHAAAIVVLLVGLWRAARPAARRLLPGWVRRDTLVAGCLMLAALAVRVWNLGRIPEGLWFDESQRGLEALRILTELGYRPIFAAGVLQEPTGLWYLMAPLLAVFGRDALALRLPVAVAGAVGVGAIYLLAWVLYGRRVAVVAAALAVTLTWHLNFSRIALPAVVSLTCDTLAVALLVAGLRRSSLFWLGASGVAAAAGLFFYFTSQLLPLVLAVVVLHHLFIQWRTGRVGRTGRSAFVRRYGVGLAVCAAAFLLTAGPLALYAVTRPGDFAARANAVTVFRDVEQARSLEPIFANARAHLLMFQVRGDNNGRHNWSGHPMLDPLTGGLSMAGLALALAAGAGLPTILLVAWLPIALAGGILSSIWDAPQSHRSIDALVPVVILAALPLGLLWERAERLLRGGGRLLRAGGRLAVESAPDSGARIAGRRVGMTRAGGWRLLPTAVVFGVLVLGGAGNLLRFFGQQQADIRTWDGFMAAQTAAGRVVNVLPLDMPAYLEPQWVDHPSVRFLDAGEHQRRPFDPGGSLPVTETSAAIIIGARSGVAERIVALYPATERAITVAPNGSIAGYAFALSPEAVQSTRGVLAQYRAGGRVAERRESSLSMLFGTGAPLPAPFDATWTTTLTVPATGTYRLRVDGPPALALTVDGLDLVRGGGEAALRLARGNHALRLVGSGLGTDAAAVAVRWAAPGQDLTPIPPQFSNVAPIQAEGLVARAFAGPEPQGEPGAEQIDANVELRTHLLPLPRPYTLEWSGAVRAERAGRYLFGISSLGAGSLWIDGALIVQKPAPDGLAEVEVQLTRGWHDIRVRFVDSTDFSHVSLLWQPPGGAPAVVPPAALRPWPAARVPAARPEDAVAP
jgi:hypothetical protein